MKIEWIRKVMADGKHNAFTGLAYFQNKYYLAYRKAVGHMTDDAYQIIMTSTNAKDWTIAHKKYFEYEKGRVYDYRDSFFLVLDDKLLLYSFATLVQNGSRCKTHSFVQEINSESSEWPSPKLIQQGCAIWKPIKYGNDFYATGYFKKENYQIYLYHSHDGFTWHKKSYIAAGSETSLYAPDETTLIAFVRTETAPYYMEIYTSAKPFDKWNKIYESSIIIQSPHVLNINGEIYLLGRERPDYLSTADFSKPSFAKHRTKIWRFANNTLKEVLELPSKGDNAYPGTAIMPDGTLLMSYYSQHETDEGTTWTDKMITDIFIGKINFS